MSKKVIIGIIIALVIIGGGVAYLAINQTTTKDDKTGQTDSTDTADDSKTSVFAPTTTSGKDFVATIEAEGADVPISTFEFDADSKAVRYKTTQQDESVESITTADAYYLKTPQGWVKYDTGTGKNSGVDPETYQYNKEKIAEVKSTSTYDGVKKCGDETCKVWKISNDGGSESAVYVSTKTNYVVKVVSTFGGKTSAISYDYKDVTVDVPTDAKELP